MALQPAAGARDLHPRQVDRNRQLCQRLAAVYRLWGYREVAPPMVERLDTLEAGGGIAERDVARLIAEEPLGLRPELTASIARAACTRLADRPRPLRLWAEGSTFRTFTGDGGGQRLSERLQSGVELLGVRSAAADAELMALLLACSETLGLQASHQPRLLVGHHGVLSALLEDLPAAHRPRARQALSGFDPLAIARLPLPQAQIDRLQALLRLRGEPTVVLPQLRRHLGESPLIDELAGSLEIVAPTAARLGISLQLDPSFQPHFDLYDGIVLKLVCLGAEAPVEIASGGRYDALVGRFGAEATEAAGVGFGFSIEDIRDLLLRPGSRDPAGRPVLVAYGNHSSLARALDCLARLHDKGQSAELLPDACPSRDQAEAAAQRRGCSALEWLH
ncbi:ATP phosphoribosyltransferase regulatory subunit [Synechococcus sp. BSF8S]|uniref:ATP phosphoribosyltransferase regulatory subunit n=1 Tax=Synechococcales TaxID=1890424 RepID=UPI001628AF53|nr:MULTISPECIES: ATP phosphoribosyltransferase regulatory subunit [unclassified Synechococcus]MBC1260228.1 ATP phosphoribosyltransferase regulatory subunit [Synechococcus sp. BSF8S]MBC1262955.1 ATP phosphoribosyltransferase regulatory subunit [Synechococcus sp. BSA11S]